MKKVSKLSDLIGIKLYTNVIDIIGEQLNILDKSYGAERNIDTDFAGGPDSLF